MSARDLSPEVTHAPAETAEAATGEGFAFFRWHCLSFPTDVPHECERHYFCHRMWEAADR